MIFISAPLKGDCGIVDFYSITRRIVKVNKARWRRRFLFIESKKNLDLENSVVLGVKIALNSVKKL
jgi:hypothetical protein